MKKFLAYIIVGIVSTISTLAIIHYYNDSIFTTLKHNESSDKDVFKLASYNGNLPNDAFIGAAKISTPAVVHINTKMKLKKQDRNMQNKNPFFQFFYHYSQT